jgi:ankyrin repeat protein
MSNIDSRLVDAARRGDYDLVSSLLSQGIDIDQMSSDWTALIIASRHGHERVVTLLIERGANLDLQDHVSIL